MRLAHPTRAAVPAAPVATVLAAVLTLAAVALVGATASGSAHAQTRPGNLEALMRQFGIASWVPSYALQAISADDEVVSVADDGRSLWLSFMSRPRVVRWQDGALWAAGEIDTKGVYFAYAIGAAGADVWAVGHEGGMARRTNGEWQTVGPVSPADLYAVVGSAADEVFAVGFDYTTNAGAIVRFDGRRAALVTGPKLDGRLLFSAAIDPAGNLWVGGCTAVADPRPVAWRYDGYDWQEVELPVQHGCLTDLAFGADGRGLAAAGSDVMAWDGARWTAFGLAPPAADRDANPPRPDGLQWVRVALTVRQTLEGPAVTGAAIAGLPTFRGFTNGAAVWRFDGTRWSDTAVDDLGWSDAFHQVDIEPPLAWLDLTARGDGTLVVAASLPSASGQPTAAEGAVGLFELQDDALRLIHPLAGPTPGDGSGARTGAAALGGDVAALPGSARAPGAHWLASARGTMPLLGNGVGWVAPAAFRLTATDARWFLEPGSADTAWAWRVEPRPGTTELLGWRDGAWHAAELPAGGGPRQLRDVGGGRLWARRDNELMMYDGDAWSRVGGAPPLAAGGPVCGGAGVKFALGAGCEGLVAPFDAAVGPGGTEMGWAAGDDGALHQWLGARWAPSPVSVRGTVLDLQMVSPRAGWAIGRDDAATRPPGTPRGVVLRLNGGNWSEVSARDVTIPSGDGSDQVGRLIDVEWRLLAAVDPTEALLYGVATFQLAAVAQDVPVLVQVRGDRAVLLLECPLAALAAARSGRDTDIWLLDQGAQRGCNRSRNPRLPIRREPEQPVGGYQSLLGHIHWAALPQTVYLPVAIDR